METERKKELGRGCERGDGELQGGGWPCCISAILGSQKTRERWCLDYSSQKPRGHGDWGILGNAVQKKERFATDSLNGKVVGGYSASSVEDQLHGAAPQRWIGPLGEGKNRGSMGQIK